MLAFPTTIFRGMFSTICSQGDFHLAVIVGGL